jgi:hypothetical protein
MKHRHKLSQRQRQRAASQSRRSEVQETDEQQHSSGGKARKRTAHQMHAEGGRTKPRLDKFRRVRRPKRFEDGGSTRSDDPGNEISAANRERKGTLGRISDELFGPRNAYARGGRQKHRGYDAGGATQMADFISDPTPDPVTRFVKANVPPVSRQLSAPPRTFPVKSVFPGANKPLGSKRGGRQKPRGYDDGGGIADSSPVKPANLVIGDGPPAPPRISSDGTAIPSSAPRANDASFVNRLNAAQKNAQLKQRVRQLEKGR